MNQPKLVPVADDYDDSAALLANLIELTSALEAASVKDGAQALAFAQRISVDAAVLDLDMPHIDGVETARRIHALYGQQRPLLVAMTGGSGLRATRSGLFDHVLLKPLDPQELMRLLLAGCATSRA